MSKFKQKFLQHVRTRAFWDGVLIGFVGGLLFMLVVRAVAL